MKVTTIKTLEKDLLFQYQKLVMWDDIARSCNGPNDRELLNDIKGEIDQQKERVKVFARQYFSARKVVAANARRRQDED